MVFYDDIIEYKDYLEHKGTDHTKPGQYTHTGSGRYSWGSGKNPYQHRVDFLHDVQVLKEQGKTQKEILEYFQMDSISEYKSAYQYATNKELLANMARARDMIENRGMSNSAVARELGVTEGNIRYWIKNDWLPKKSSVFDTIDKLNAAVEEKGMIDVGKGVNTELGISQETMNTALKAIKNEGKYHVIEVYEPQATNPEQKTTIKVLCSKNIDEGEAFKRRFDIKTITDYANTTESGKTAFGIHYPEALDSKRIYIRYDEDGGSNRDGVIELRPGLKDISLGGSAYAQVRINVDDKYYAKGMAIYSDKIPKGYDILINSNKTKGTPLNKVLKPLKEDKNGNIDRENPFGALIKIGGQEFYQDKNGKYIKDPVNELGFKKAKDISKVDPSERYSLGLVNKIREEGDWEKYSKTLSSQFLSKQPLDLIKKQLNLDIANKRKELDDIRSIKNPEIKKKCLEDFAEACDKSAVELKAAPLPRQCTKVILPVTTLKDDEVYAPGFRDGEHIALIRYPHQGTFEIPILKVNNKHPDGKKIVGPSAIDAIGININNANRMSGADFDGDTVMAIPTLRGSGVNGVHIKNTDMTGEFKKLYGFDPKKAYPGYKGMKVLSEEDKQREMGIISNLVTDMTLQGAPPSDLVKAVRHAQTIIDAPKHELDWKTSMLDNDIPALHKKYQGKTRGGASTIISRSSKEIDIKQEKAGKIVTDPETGKTKRLYFNPKTGEKYSQPTGKMKVVREKYIDVNGKTKWRDKTDKDGNKIYEPVTMKATMMSRVKDARELMSTGRFEQEKIYAGYANILKSMANETRKETLTIGKTHRSKLAADTYAKEVASLNAKVKNAELNAPRERQANLIADKIVTDKRKTNNFDKDELKKARTQAINYAREAVGARSKDRKVKLSEKEWQAIESGAISSTMINNIIKFSDTDQLKSLAMPKDQKKLNKAQISLMKSMKSSGYTLSEIAERLGVSVSTVSKNIKS